MFLQRAFIYPKDVQRITGRSLRYAQKTIIKMRHHFGKTATQQITIDEFAQFSGLSKHVIISYLD